MFAFKEDFSFVCEEAQDNFIIVYKANIMSMAKKNFKQDP